jgi:hypothetical protein
MKYFVVDIETLLIFEKEGSAGDFLQTKNSFNQYPFETKREALEFLRFKALSLLPQINRIIDNVEPIISMRIEVKLSSPRRHSEVRTFIEESMVTLSEKLGEEIAVKINFV